MAHYTPPEDARAGEGYRELFAELLARHRLGLGLTLAFSLGAVWLSFWGPPDEPGEPSEEEEGEALAGAAEAGDASAPSAPGPGEQPKEPEAKAD